MRKEMRRTPPSANRLIGIVSSVTGVDIMRNTRIREFVEGRSIFYHIYRNMEGWTLSDIGALFDKDHATVLHGIKTIEIFMEQEPRLKSLYDRCLNLYKGLDNPELETDKQKLVNKLSQLDGRIVDLNTYIAELRSEIRELKEQNSEYSEVLDVVRMYTPKGKVEEAKKKVRAVLNGL
jgi:hypothetical protein